MGTKSRKQIELDQERLTLKREKLALEGERLKVQRLKAEGVAAKAKLDEERLRVQRIKAEAAQAKAKLDEERLRVQRIKAETAKAKRTPTFDELTEAALNAPPIPFEQLDTYTQHSVIVENAKRVGTYVPEQEPEISLERTANRFPDDSTIATTSCICCGSSEYQFDNLGYRLCATCGPEMWTVRREEDRRRFRPGAGWCSIHDNVHYPATATLYGRPVTIPGTFPQEEVMPGTRAPPDRPLRDPLPGPVPEPMPPPNTPKHLRAREAAGIPIMRPITFRPGTEPKTPFWWGGEKPPK